MLSCLPANPAFGFLFCPPSPKGKDIPPTRARRALFPGGEGGDKGYFYARGFAPCIPGGLDGARHWLDLPVRHSAGGLLSCLPANIAFSLLSCPLSPQPPSPAGKGETKVIFMQGASPLASPRLSRRRHWNRGANRAPGGGCAPALSPACPAFSFVFCPHPPQPPSRREGGESRLFHARGFAPCIPEG